MIHKLLRFLAINPLRKIKVTTHEIKKHQDSWNLRPLLIDPKLCMDILSVPRQSLEVLTEIILQTRPSIPLVQLRKHMRLNNEKDQRIPTILIHIPDSVEVIGSDNPVCTLGQEHCSGKRRKGVGSLGGWSDGHKNWHAHRSPSVAMMWHCHDKATVINLWQGSSLARNASLATWLRPRRLHRPCYVHK